MKAVVISTRDIASVNIGSKLKGMMDFDDAGTFFNHPVLKYGDWYIFTMDKLHLEADLLEEDIVPTFGQVDLLVFASRHSSKSGLRTLTVHAPGNLSTADFGGRPRCLAPSAPHRMTQALLNVARRAHGRAYNVSFEVTHHGPYVEVPAFFIEVGSTRSEWEDPDAGRILARSIADMMLKGVQDARHVLIGIGGGHYAPRFTDVALEYDVSFGHLIPSYHLDALDGDMLLQALDKTRADGAYLHRKALRSEDRSRIQTLLQDLDVRVYRSRDLLRRNVSDRH